MQKFVLAFVLAITALTLYTLVDIITSSEQAVEKKAAAPKPETATETEHKVPKLAKLSVAQRKEKFVEHVLPAILKVKGRLDAEYDKAKRIASEKNPTSVDEAWLESKMFEYDVTDTPCLLRRMHTHPVSIVIAQAALETGWGTSRFFVKANNMFGIWSYHDDEQRIRASVSRKDKTVYVKKYDTLTDAIRGYYAMISSGYAYNNFRKARMKTDNPFELLRYLRRYSELRDEYVARLYSVIKANKLYRYDDPSYAPIALSQILPEYVARKREAAEKANAREQDAQEVLALNEVKSDPDDDTPSACKDGEEPETDDAVDNTTAAAPSPATAAPAHSSLP
jgi:Bax protein